MGSPTGSLCPSHGFFLKNFKLLVATGSLKDSLLQDTELLTPQKIAGISSVLLRKHVKFCILRTSLYRLNSCSIAQMEEGRGKPGRGPALMIIYVIQYLKTRQLRSYVLVGKFPLFCKFLHLTLI